MSVLLSSTLANETTPYYALAGAPAPAPVDGILPGMIVMWAGQFVPLGYTLCNGAFGSPDLRNRFIVAAAVPGSGPQTYPAGTSGGSATATLGLTNLPDHIHGGVGLAAQGGQASGTPDANYASTANNTTGITSPGWTAPQPFDIVPPYYALAFLYKL